MGLLFMRAAIGLAVVLLMTDKPLLTASLVVIGVAVAIGLTISLLSMRRGAGHLMARIG